MPGLISGLLSALVCFFATNEIYGPSLYIIFPNHAPEDLTDIQDNFDEVMFTNYLYKVTPEVLISLKCHSPGGAIFFWKLDSFSSIHGFNTIPIGALGYFNLFSDVSKV